MSTIEAISQNTVATKSDIERIEKEIIETKGEIKLIKWMIGLVIAIIAALFLACDIGYLTWDSYKVLKEHEAKNR